MQKRHVKHPFGAVITDEARVLILGSVPSVMSVERNFFYMHPQNRFWKVMSALLGERLYDVPTDERIAVLNRRGVALYDSVEECDIDGSSDSKISNVVPANIPALVARSKICKIFCNGNASYQNLVAFHPELADMALRLPSTSPANASFGMERLLKEWAVILDFLPPAPPASNDSSTEGRKEF